MPPIKYFCIRHDGYVTEECSAHHVCERGICKACTRKILEECFNSTGQVEIYQRIVSRLDRRRKKNGKSIEKQKESSGNLTETSPEENRESGNRASTRAA